MGAPRLRPSIWMLGLTHPGAQLFVADLQPDSVLAVDLSPRIFTVLFSMIDGFIEQAVAIYG